MNNQLLGYVNLAGKNDSAEAKHGALKEFFEEEQIPLAYLIDICSDGKVTNTGEGRGILRRFEKQLNRALHWWICLLHFNELPFRHLYETLEKSRSTGPRTSTGSLEKDLHNCHTQQILQPSHGFFALYYGDRFIPRRYILKNLNTNLKFANKNMEKDVLKVPFASNYWRQNSLKIALNKTLQLKEGRILQLSDHLWEVSEKHTIAFHCLNDYSHDYDWHCIPRSKPLAFAETTHDSPGFDSTFGPNMVDWSVNEQIVASFGQDVIIWKRSDDVTMLFHVKSIKSLAYSPDGNILAIGCKTKEYPVLELWKVGFSTKFLVVNGKVFSSDHGDLHSIVWTNTGTQVICGTGLGCLYVLSVPDLNVMRKVRRHKMPIERIKISPNMRYLASGDSSGDIVVYNWSSCEVYLVVCSKRKLHTDFDWHPWNGDDLIIAETVPASIVVLHVPNKEIVAYYQRMDRRIVINYLTFNKITAELLVSVSMAGDDGCWDFKILVMASLNRVVDLINIPESGARFVVWSPDGTKLATSGNDETLTIWNFRPENKTETTGNQRKSAHYIWNSEFGSVFASWACLK